jgi:predicted permease
MADLRFAVRTLLRTPAFTLTALATLALGIGANAAIFSIVHGVLLRELPYPEAARLVQVHIANPQRGISDASLSLIDVEDWRARARHVERVAGHFESRMTLTGRGEPTEILHAFVTDGFFEALGVHARLGRALQEHDHRQAARVAVLSEGTWRSRFGGDPDVIGAAITLDHQPFTIVGVMPLDFRFPSSDVAVWVPVTLLTPDDIGPRVRDNRLLSGLARVRAGSSHREAEAELTSIAATLAREFPDTNEGWDTVRVVGLQDAMVGDVRAALLVVLGVVGFVLLIACANLAHLLLARATSRSREFAVRHALGASRGRLVRQLLVESLVLAAAGGALGIAFSAWAVDVVLHLGADTLPRLDDVRLDWAVVGYTSGVTLLAGLLFGIVPALRATREEGHASLRSGRGWVGSDRPRLRATLVVAEVSLAVVLVIGAGLMARSFLALRSVDPGFDPDRVLAVSLRISLPPGSADEQIAFLHARKLAFIDRVRALPAVTAVGSIQRLPLRGAGEPWEFSRPDGTDPRPVRVDARFVNPEYFAAMGIPLLAGRVFAEQPTPGDSVQVVLSAAAARRFWPGEDPVGKYLRFGQSPVEVTGVAGDVRQRGLAAEPEPAVYVSQYQAPRVAVNLVVRSSGEPARLAPAVQAAIREVDPGQPITGVATLGEVVGDSIAQERFFSALFVAFGGIALLLAAVGVYGVLAYDVEQRTREFGVRMALGARAADVLRLVIGSSLALVLAGVALGIGTALIVTRVLASLLYGVGATDPLTFAGVATLLVVVACLAAYVPARRATRVDPMVALRAE